MIRIFLFYPRDLYSLSVPFSQDLNIATGGEAAEGYAAGGSSNWRRSYWGPSLLGDTASGGVATGIISY